MILSQVLGSEQLIEAINKQCIKFNETYKGHWVYRSILGDVIGVTCRTENISGAKAVKPWVYMDGKWAPKGFGGMTKPMYGIHKLKMRPGLPVFIVEGEKTADAAQDILGDYNVITWLGGANAASKADVSELVDLKVYLMPDNDDAGYEAMQEIARRLYKQGCQLYIVDVKSLGVDKGWDLADLYQSYGVVDSYQVLDLIKNTKPYSYQFICINKSSFPDASEKGSIINTTDNIEYLINFYDVSVKHNLMTHTNEYKCLGKRYSKERETSCNFTEISNLCVKNGVPKNDLEYHLQSIADRNSYHPARDYILSFPWDSVTRIDDFINTVNAVDEHLAKKLIFKWMLGAVAAAFSDSGLSLDGVLVLQGEQGIGKTHWFEKLCPKLLRKSGLRLDPDNKDSVMICTQSWLIELGELDATINRSASSAQKQFITQSVDKYRAPYDRYTQEVPRRTAYVGTVNHMNYLNDITGNRRFWTIQCNSIDHNHNIDMQQVWAEVKAILDSGETHRLDTYEQNSLKESNKNFEEIDPLHELISSGFRWGEKGTRNMTCSDILLEMGYSRPTKSEIKRVAIFLKNMKIEKGTGRSRYHFIMPQIRTRSI